MWRLTSHLPGLVLSEDSLKTAFPGMARNSTEAALLAGRNSVGVEVDREYVELARSRLLDETNELFGRGRLRVEGHGSIQSDV